MDRRCFEADCSYHTERMNGFLQRLHLAPITFFGIAVSVRNGMVMQVAVFIVRQGLTPISLTQTTALPTECTANPCVKQLVRPNKKPLNIKVMFNNESEFRDRMPEAFQTACLSRLHGCRTYEELLPLARELNIAAVATSK